VTDQPEIPDQQPVAASAGASAPEPEASWTAVDGSARRSGDRPEVAVGAAFAGGFLLAMILRRLAR
jgi:hypothetical protein